MADYLVNPPFCSDNFIRSYKIVRKAGDRSKYMSYFILIIYFFQILKLKIIES